MKKQSHGKQVGMGEKIGKHLEQGASLQDKGGEGDFGEVHAHTQLTQQVHDQTAVFLDVLHWKF